MSVFNLASNELSVSCCSLIGSLPPRFTSSFVLLFRFCIARSWSMICCGFGASSDNFRKCSRSVLACDTRKMFTFCKTAYFSHRWAQPLQEISVGQISSWKIGFATRRPKKVLNLTIIHTITIYVILRTVNRETNGDFLHHTSIPPFDKDIIISTSFDISWRVVALLRLSRNCIQVSNQKTVFFIHP